MNYIATADTDIGIRKEINQDSVVIKHAIAYGKQVLMAIICDGMGGLAKGELASATVVRTFAEWFDNELPLELGRANLEVIGTKWALMLKELNGRILEYSSQHGGNAIGTTFTGILFIDDQYTIVHVGDCRVYRIDNALTQLTTDQTFVAREISRGNMTEEQAKVDKRRNLLLQCVGASKSIEPQIICGRAKAGVYMLCSDGFRHDVTNAELYDALNPQRLSSKEAMHSSARFLIDTVKYRGERDNITCVLVRAQ